MRVLVIAPHNDDEILGCGGTMAKYAKKGDEVIVCEVTAGDLDDPIVQLQKSEAKMSHDLLCVAETVFMDLPVVGLKELTTRELNAQFLKLIQEIKPDVVFMPHKGDMHIDHRMVIEAAMVAMRPVSCPNLKAIYAYETLSETEWNIPCADNAFIPTVYSDITNEIDLKINAMKCHGSQLCDYPHPRSLEAIKALAMHRGSTLCMAYAEAFMIIREVL